MVIQQGLKSVLIAASISNYIVIPSVERRDASSITDRTPCIAGSTGATAAAVSAAARCNCCSNWSWSIYSCSDARDLVRRPASASAATAAPVQQQQWQTPAAEQGW